MDDRYVLGYPRIALARVIAELPSTFVVLILFVLTPAAACWSVFASPDHGHWEVVGAVVLGLFALNTTKGIVGWFCRKFGLRVVPRFDRRMDEEPGTYFGGYSLVSQVQQLDLLASSLGVPSLTDFGVGEPDHRPGTLWFDCAAGERALRAFAAAAGTRGMPSEVVAELMTITNALAKAGRVGARFRLVVVTGTSMNDQLWRQLRDAGF